MEKVTKTLKDLARRYRIVLEIMWLLLGLLLLVSSSLLDSKSSLVRALFAFSVSVTASAFVTCLNHLFRADAPLLEELDERISEQLKSLIPQAMGIVGTGLKALHPGEPDQEIFQSFARAESICIMKNTGRTTLQRQAERLKNAILMNGCNVRILLSDPENPAFLHGPISEGLCPAGDITYIPRDVGLARSRLESLVKELQALQPRPNGGSVELRYMQCLPPCSMIMVDDSELRLTPYLPYTHSADAPTLDFGADRRGQVIEKYRSAFDRAWNEGKQVFRTEFGERLQH